MLMATSTLGLGTLERRVGPVSSYTPMVMCFGVIGPMIKLMAQDFSSMFFHDPLYTL